MTDEKLEEKARQKARIYTTEYAEDCELRDMISRPEDFIDGAIEHMYLLLKEKHYRDGYIDGFKAREEKAEKENAELKEQVERLKKENAELKGEVKNNEDLATVAYMQGADNQKKKSEKQLTKAKEIMSIAIEGIKHWGIVGGTERPFEKQAEMLFNLFLDKAEQFLEENQMNIEELNSSNAELEEQVSAMSKALVLNTSENDKQLAKADEKLIKAKKMISNLLYVYQLGKNELAIARIRAEAEQFLKEVSE